MPDAGTLELGSVQKTLLLPLWGRAVETRSSHPLLVDETAVRIMAEIGYDFSTIARNTSPISQLCWIARSLHIDRTLREFLEYHPQATVVNLGCGMDTTFERIDNGRVHWYDLDLPDVIALRRRFIPETGRRQLLASSLFDYEWLHQLKVEDAVFLAAAGVLYYFTEDQVRAFLLTLADAFPGCQLIFDACSAFGLRTANKKVITAGGMDDSAFLKWSLERAQLLESWDRRIVVRAEYPMFRKLKLAVEPKKRWGMFMSDTLRVMSMVHLRLG